MVIFIPLPTSRRIPISKQMKTMTAEEALHLEIPVFWSLKLQGGCTCRRKKRKNEGITFSFFHGTSPMLRIKTAFRPAPEQFRNFRQT
jgi:hypothetical protein